MSDRAVHLLVSGRVQGVGFRAWAARRAEELGLSGWVRNTPEGKVEAVLAGNEHALNSMIAALRQGPRLAEVSAVEELGPVAEPASGFRILTNR